MAKNAPQNPVSKDFTREELLSGIRKLERRLADLRSMDPGKTPFDDPKVDRIQSDISATILDVFGPNSPEFREHQYFMINQGPFQINEPEAATQGNFERGYPHAVEILTGLSNRLTEKLEDLKPAEVYSNWETQLSRMLDRFPIFIRRLKDRHGGRTTIQILDEFDVQDLISALLAIQFDDIRREEWTPSHAGSPARMDILLKAERAVIEVKMTRGGLGEKEVGVQLIEDVAKYGVHPDCKSLYCFVYDPERRIGNPRGLERDLSGSKNGLKVVAMVRT